MKYADETSFGHSLSIARWKPITMERFIAALHGYAVDNCDPHGNSGLASTKSVKVDKLQTATVYYVPKDGVGGSVHGVHRPVLLTLSSPGGKIITMEYVAEGERHELGTGSDALVLDTEAFLRR